MAEEQHGPEPKPEEGLSTDYEGMMAAAQGSQEPDENRAHVMAKAENLNRKTAAKIRSLPYTEPHRDEAAAKLDAQANRLGQEAGIRYDLENAGHQEPDSERAVDMAHAADANMREASELKKAADAQTRLRDQNDIKKGPLLTSMYRFVREDILNRRANKARSEADKAADKAGQDYDKEQELPK